MVKNIQLNITLNMNGKKITAIKMWRTIIGTDHPQGCLTEAKIFVETNDGKDLSIILNDAQFGRLVIESTLASNLGWQESPQLNYWGIKYAPDATQYDFTR